MEKRAWPAGMDHVARVSVGLAPLPHLKHPGLRAFETPSGQDAACPTVFGVALAVLGEDCRTVDSRAPGASMLRHNAGSAALGFALPSARQVALKSVKLAQARPGMHPGLS